MKVPTGVKRLDDLLQGGLAPLSQALLYGPPFLGKDVLARTFISAGLRADIPAVVVLTNESAAQARARFLEIDPGYEAHEASGLIRYVDAYSRPLGGPEDEPHTEYVDGPMNLNGLSHAIGEAEKAVTLGHESHRFLLDSVSTLIAFSNAQTAFRFLQVLIGRIRMAGATGALLLDHGMHTEAEVQMFKHLVSGVIEVRAEAGKQQLLIQGLGLTQSPGWVDYEFTETSFSVTGSFSSGRIR